MKNYECEHGANATYCKPCFQEIHTSYLEILKEQARESNRVMLMANQEPDIHSMEFLRQV
jgi:hypothetical protein